MVNKLEGALSKKRASKIETYYGPMIYGGYPLLYAVMLDLKSPNPQSLNHVTSNSFVPFDDEPAYVDIAERGNKALQQLSVPLLSTPYSRSFMIESPHGGHSEFHYTAASETDLLIFASGHQKLVESLNTCFNQGSFTMRVLDQLTATHPEVDSAFMLYSAVRAVVDGFLSTYEAAAHLSRSEMEGSHEETLPRLLKILRSNAHTEFTKKVKTSVLTNMGLLACAPERAIKIINGEPTLHPDMLAFLNVANDQISLKLPHPLICPFAIPLGNRLDEALSFYGGNLPDEVVALMQQNKLTPGITSAGSAIATVLEKPLSHYFPAFEEVREEFNEGSSGHSLRR